MEFGVAIDLARALREDAGAVGKCIADGSAELPQYLSQRFLELFIDHYVLVDTEVFRWKFRKLGYTQVRVLFPVVMIF